MILNYLERLLSTQLIFLILRGINGEKKSTRVGSMDRYVCVRCSRRLGASAGRGVGRGEVCYGGGRKRPMARVTTALRRQVVERAPPPSPPPPPGLPPSGHRDTIAFVVPFHLTVPKSVCSSLPRPLSITPILDYKTLPITLPTISIWPEIPKGHFALLQVTRVVVPMLNYTFGATVES